MFMQKDQNQIQKFQCIQKVRLQKLFVVFENYFVVCKNYSVVFRNYSMVQGFLGIGFRVGLGLTAPCLVEGDRCVRSRWALQPLNGRFPAPDVYFISGWTIH